MLIIERDLLIMRRMIKVRFFNLIIFVVISVFVVSCADLVSGLKSSPKDLAQQEGFKADDKNDFPSGFKKEFCKPERIKQIAKNDAQDFINKKSKSDFNVCKDQNFYSVYLNEYGKSLKAACSSLSFLSKKASSFARTNLQIEEGTKFIKVGCPKNLVKSASKIFTVAYLSAATVHSYKNSAVESQGVLSPKEEALLVEKIKLNEQVKQIEFQQKIQNWLPNQMRDIQKYR